MTLAISLSRTAEKRLSEVAKAEGIDLSTLASQLLESEAERIEFQRKLNQPTIDLLNAFVTKTQGRYIELTDRQLKRAAELWANVLQRGRPTADPHALDIDVILAA